MKKYQILLLSILFDALGLVSFVFPLFDIIWAPLSAYLMTKMYQGREGKIAAVISFLEEALPFLDVIPSFSLMWLYTYVFNRTDKKTEKVGT